ncbi:helix-turn-helix domain-containing protein [Streptomyces sulphureus]|uniref:helix-turn-helix domain-containing protein n=1 Tax=Streptomyces sulphureus TaxID=47758 RepID=UPI000366411D|nr:helix-turn-helix domain-containing protein [Streptomyces sulphureus]
MSTDPTVQSEKAQHGARGEVKRRPPRLRGDERTAMAKQFGEQYEAGASIRDLIAEHGLSYGLTRTLLLEAGVTLRSRRGGRETRSS